MSGKLLLIYICNFHVLSNLLLNYICKLHWNPDFSDLFIPPPLGHITISNTKLRPFVYQIDNYETTELDVITKEELVCTLHLQKEHTDVIDGVEMAFHHFNAITKKVHFLY